jgi:hypothetical protein
MKPVPLDVQIRSLQEYVLPMHTGLDKTVELMVNAVKVMEQTNEKLK